MGTTNIFGQCRSISDMPKKIPGIFLGTKLPFLKSLKIPNELQNIKYNQQHSWLTTIRGK